MTIKVVPASRADVAAFITQIHRNHKPPCGDIFRLACVDETGKVRGVASIGRPVARMLDDGWTLEVSRVATDGVTNGCSLLYGASRKIAWAMGYRRMFTYTLPEEGGASLRASGWIEDGAAGGGEGWLKHPRNSGKVERSDIKIRWSCMNQAASSVETEWPKTKESHQMRLL
jgi:hypothetical protein